MNEVLISNKNIEDMIYEIRGVQVMLDSDLARIYETETKRINEAVSRNPLKFPEKYCWVLSNEESELLLVANCDQKVETRGGRYKNPRVFTEQAVAMLATILKTPKAVQMSLAIIDAFVKMRHFISDNKDAYMSINRIGNKIIEHDEKINYIFSKFDKKETILLNGEVFDGYLYILEILNTAKENIIVLDNYADITFLNLIRNIKCDVTLITKSSDRLSDLEITKYNSEYHNLKVIRNNESHDRFIVIDNSMISLMNYKHVSALLCNYSRLKEDCYGNFYTDGYFLMEDLDNLIQNALSNFPVYLDLLIFKIDGKSNLQIQNLLLDLHDTRYSIEYISCLWRNKIPKMIAEQAEKEYLQWYYTIKKKGKWKTCTRCKQVKLANNKFGLISF